MDRAVQEKEALWEAAESGDVKTLRAALDEDPSWLQVWHEWGSNPSREMTLLHVAAEWDQLDVAQLLLDAGADPALFGPPDNPTITPLHRSGCRGTKVMRLLLDAGIPADIKAKRGVTPLYTAAFHGNVAGCELLLERGARPDGYGSRPPLFPAAQNGHTDVIDLLVNAGARLNKKSSKKETALHLATRNGHLATTKRLVALGLDPDQGDKHGQTPREQGSSNPEIKDFFDTLP